MQGRVHALIRGEGVIDDVGAPAEAVRSNLETRMRRVFALTVALLLAGPAGAACFPETTYTDANAEYTHSALVVTAQVTAEQDILDHEDSDQSVAGTRYTLRVVERFKGKPPERLVISSENTSGRFPMERGQAYLLFLDSPRDGQYGVNNCGQSADVRERSSVLVALRAKY